MKQLPRAEGTQEREKLGEGKDGSDPVQDAMLEDRVIGSLRIIDPEDVLLIRYGSSTLLLGYASTLLAQVQRSRVLSRQQGYPTICPGPGSCTL